MKRKVTGRVSLGEIPNLMRALGFYPTQKQIQRMTDEIHINRGRSSTQQSQPLRENADGETEARDTRSARARAQTQDINLHDFVKLYINHRPVFGVTNDDIADAFAVLGADETAGGTMSWSELKYRLQNEGEKISDAELNKILNALTGGEPPSSRLTAGEFADEILGFAGE